APDPPSRAEIASRSDEGNRSASDSYPFPSSGGASSTPDSRRCSPAARSAPPRGPGQPRREQRREREVRVDVPARDPCLDALRAPMADDPEPARAVVVPPGERRRRPAPRGITLVRVDVRREEERELLRARDPAGEEALERLAAAGER